MTEDEIKALAAKYADNFIKKISYPLDANSLWKTAYKSFLDGLNHNKENK